MFALSHRSLSLTDQARRAQGRVLEAFGFAPQLTPARTAYRAALFELLAYGSGPRSASPVLVVPAPIKRFYIWDLARGASAVGRLVAAGHPVYLVAWQPPPHGNFGLVHYAEHSIGRALDVVCDQTGVRDAFVAGHSLGGTLAAIFAALHPQRVRSLIALEAPIEFSNGALETFARATPPATVTGTVPGTLLDLAAVAAAPETFGAEPLLDRMLSLPSVQATALHLRVRRWTLDELPMPARLFEEVSRELYRENRFALGTLELAGRRAHPRAIRAPILVVADPRSRIVPRSDLLAYGTRTSSTDVEFLDYRGDVGVMLQHVGVLVGANAHRQVWPRIIGWLAAHGMDRAARRS